jgi:hypothetical protein
MEPHQERVVAEYREASARLQRLSEFIKLNPVFATLPLAECRRLVRQQTYMFLYVEVLNERIEAFK